MKDTVDDGRKTNWKSIYIATVLSFVGTVQYNLFFSALWPYLETLDKTATEDFFGYIIAIYSVGQMIISPIFGYWSNKIKQVKLPLIVGIILMFFGNLIYLSMTLIPLSPKFTLFIGRYITGAGSSNSPLLTTYASSASTLKDRSKAVGYISCGQALGAVRGPGFQLIFSPLGYPGFGFIDYLRFNLYTAPAYFAIVVNILGILILLFCFKEDYAGIIEEDSEPSKESESHENLPNFDLIAVSVCLLTRFTYIFFMSNLETIGSAFSMIMFDFSKTKAVKFVAAAQSGVGALTLLTYIFYMFFHIERHINPRKICITSITAFLLFYLLTYSWRFIPGNVSIQSANSTNDTGCDAEKFSWCESLAPINVYLYYTAYVVVIGFAYPLVNVTLTTLYSKILGPRRQGVTQGIFQIAGGCARLTGPLALSILYTAFGPRMTWKVEMAVLAITIAAWILFYRKMVPLKYGWEKDEEEDYGSNNCKKPKIDNEHENVNENVIHAKVPKFEDMLISMDQPKTKQSI